MLRLKKSLIAFIGPHKLTSKKLKLVFLADYDWKRNGKINIKTQSYHFQIYCKVTSKHFVPYLSIDYYANTTLKISYAEEKHLTFALSIPLINFKFLQRSFYLWNIRTRNSILPLFCQIPETCCFITEISCNNP